MRALSIAATGMSAQQLNVEVISNNIANMNTTAFKRQRAQFEDLLYQNIQKPGDSTSAQGNVAPLGIQIGVGVKPGSVGRITQQGDLTQTGNQYDLAISGNGYFQVLMPSGDTAYTRAGNFGISADGQLVTSDGYVIQPAITIPANTTSVAVSNDGVVTATVAGQTTSTQIGQLELAAFMNPQGLEAEGDNLFRETTASGPATVATPGTDGLGTITQGSLETSNVNAVEEISSLIVAQRAYEMNAKVITASDEMLQTMTQMR